MLQEPNQNLNPPGSRQSSSRCVTWVCLSGLLCAWVYKCVLYGCVFVRFIQDFEDLGCLGRGGFGVVYKVKHKVLPKFSAIKIVRSRR